jgi:putative ABC transport system substrate-binding protein
LVRLKVDVIVTRGTPAALAAKEATGTIPIVMASSGDPVTAGIVASLAHPGANVTGLSALATDVQGKLLEVLREMVPHVARVAFLFNMSNPVLQAQWKEAERTARSMGLRSQLLDVRAVRDLEPAFDAAARQRADAVIVGIDALTQAQRERIVGTLAKRHLPAISREREFVDAGGLMSYGIHYADSYRRAATYVDKVLKGAKPADLPVEQPTKLELVINLRTAKTLGLTIPPSVLVRADQVIE